MRGCQAGTRVVAQRGGEVFQRALGVADERDGAVLAGVEGVMLSWIRAAAPGSSARQPVVKSCSRVPTPRITSASRASVLAAGCR